MLIKLLFFFSLLCNATYPHGFGQNTFVSLANNAYQSIDNLCVYTQAKKSYPAILSYKKNTKECSVAKIKSIATSKANCYCAIGFDENSLYADITCTPDQEFYSVTAQKWVPAYKLQVNEELLTKNNDSIPITYIEIISKPIDVFIIEVKKTHTFFVGRHAVLTHNIILPLSISMSIPFGSVTGATIGSFFGPLTCSIGIIAGSIIGTIIKIFNDDKIPTYKLPHYDIFYINQERDKIYHLRDHDNTTDAQAPGKPTADDGYEPPKNWDGKKVKHKNGSLGWPDKKGRIWIPTGPNGHGGPHWDVEYPKNDDYDNVYPGGKIRSKRK